MNAIRLNSKLSIGEKKTRGFKIYKTATEYILYNFNNRKGNWWNSEDGLTKNLWKNYIHLWSIIQQGHKGQSMHEAPINAGSRGRIYSTQLYSALQEPTFELVTSRSQW